MTASRIDRTKITCSVGDCPLRPVANDRCLFHDRIDWSLNYEVSKILKSDTGQKAIDASLKNRQLWAAGVEEEKVRLFRGDAENFNTHNQAFKELAYLEKRGVLPKEVDLSNKTQTLKQLKIFAGYEIWIEEDKMFFCVDWLCQTYERFIVDGVAQLALDMRVGGTNETN